MDRKELEAKIMELVAISYKKNRRSDPGDQLQG